MRAIEEAVSAIKVQGNLEVVQPPSVSPFLHHSSSSSESYDKAPNPGQYYSVDGNLLKYFKKTLLVALQSGSVEMVGVILQEGINIRGFIKSLSGTRALVTATTHSIRTELVQLLLDAGIDVNPSQDVCWSGLHSSAYHDNVKIAKLLLENGADVNKFGKWLNRGRAQTPLFHAMQGDCLAMVKILLDYGADINAEDVVKFSVRHLVLHWSCKGLAMCRQIVKLRSESLFVNEGYLEAIEENEKLRDYVRYCEREIKAMRGQMFDDTVVTLFQVFVTKDLLRLAAYARNESILNFVRSSELWERYRIYHDSVQRHLQRGCHRNFLTRRVCNFFLSLSRRREDKLPRLPAACVGMILDYLSNRDLERLRNSYF